MLATLRGTFLPQRVVALADARADTDLMPLLDQKTPLNSSPRAFVCRNYACRAPVTTAEALAADLEP